MTGTRKLVTLALLTAIVILLQAFVTLRFGTFQIAVVLAPIVIGAATCGALAGGWLGAVFGLVVLLNGDAAAFLAVNPFGTVVTVMLKRICAGLAAGAVYGMLEKKNRFAAILAAAIVSPIVNTGIFTVGCYVFFLPTLKEWAAGLDFASATAYIFIGLIGVNFILEFVVNVALAGAIERIMKYYRASAVSASAV
jgi:uncharacterized membrane protein